MTWLPPGDSVFPDVPADHRFYSAITALAKDRIMSGYANGMFGPQDLLTRAQMAKMSVLSFGRHTVATTNLGAATFPDVVYAGSDYPFDFVEEASEAGFVSGYTNGTFGPSDTLTRIQMLRIIVRAAGTALAEPPAGYDPGFIDVAPADLAVVAKAKFNNLMAGKTPTTLDPYSAATRGHAASIIHGVLMLMATESGDGMNMN